MICGHTCPHTVVPDGNENLDLTKTLLERYRIRRTVVSVYNPQSNHLVEGDRVCNYQFCKDHHKDEWTK